MLVTSMNGEALSQEHGYPVRMIVPGLFGYVSATKWLSEISLSTWDAFDAYWIERGWSKTGPFLASSRIDVPRNGASVAAGKTIVGGFAWAPRSGVKAVQLQIDDDEWLEAELLDGSTGDTWTQWKYEWNANPGGHRLTVRCVNGNGEIQTDEVTRVDPDGARGHHRIDISCA
jgi:DMSO/TMAO reductase YedYZ molybdopterin-dependent catalytic subunit